MSLKPCRECDKEVSTGAATCPHCGIQRPYISEGQHAAGGVIVLIFIVIVIAFLVWMANSSGSPSTQEAQDNYKCLTDLQCAGDKYMIPASASCQQVLEEQAKMISKWDYKIGESSFSPIFSRFRWSDSTKKQIIYVGDQAKFQNGFGAWQRVSYECTFDLSSQKPVDARFIER